LGKRASFNLVNPLSRALDFWSSPTCQRRMGTERFSIERSNSCRSSQVALSVSKDKGLCLCGARPAELKHCTNNKMLRKVKACSETNDTEEAVTRVPAGIPKYRSARGRGGYRHGRVTGGYTATTAHKQCRKVPARAEIPSYNLGCRSERECSNA
jgi:hypothetical protein